MCSPWQLPGMAAERLPATKGGLLAAAVLLAALALVQYRAAVTPYLQPVTDAVGWSGGGGGRSVAPDRSSPACKPHFQMALSDGNWTDSGSAIFSRLYFYHVRKAGGTNLRKYFQKVAAHHGLEFKAVEYDMAEDPGSSDVPTLYVTHLREPVSRSISHFKYEGRWDCKQLMNNVSFIPTEDNANKLESWNQSFGHRPTSCLYRKRNRTAVCRMSQCAVNCNIQWLAGCSCPWWDPPKHPEREGRPIRREVPIAQQHAVARAKLQRYNFIVVTEKLNDPEYVAAVERFFGVPGVNRRANHPWCEANSHYANEKIPLEIRNETIQRLTLLNEEDIRLYNEFASCLDGGEYDFPSFDLQQIQRCSPEIPSRQWRLQKFNDTT
ncbi:hypothetical protein ACHAXT_010923 [Thalassiosira profunda]